MNRMVAIIVIPFFERLGVLQMQESNVGEPIFPSFPL